MQFGDKRPPRLRDLHPLPIVQNAAVVGSLSVRALHADHHVSHNDGHERWEGADKMIEAVKAVLDKGRTTVHHSHTPDITFPSPTTAKSIWGMEDLIFDSETGELLIHGFGFYHETYEKIDGKWLFTSRQLKRTLVREKPESNKG